MANDALQAEADVETLLEDSVFLQDRLLGHRPLDADLSTLQR